MQRTTQSRAGAPLTPLAPRVASVAEPTKKQFARVGTRHKPLVCSQQSEVNAFVSQTVRVGTALTRRGRAGGPRGGPTCDKRKAI